MTATTCDHGMPTPASCTTCMLDGNLPVARQQPETAVRTFTAQYAGQCTECNLPVVPGQLMTRTSRHRNVHQGCIS